MPYHVVNAGRGRSSTHIIKSTSPSIPGLGTFVVSNVVGFGGGTTKETLCGLAATRYVNVFTPSEASCRECKKRWQLAIAAEASNPPRKEMKPLAALAVLLVCLLAVGGIITGIILAAVKADRDSGYPAKGMAARIPGCAITAATDRDLPNNETSAAKCTLPDGALVEIWTWTNNPPDTTDQQGWAYSESHPFIQLGNTPDCCIVGTSPAPWVVDISGDETYVANVRSSDWSTVQTALGGQVVTNPPASWSPYPVPTYTP